MANKTIKSTASYKSMGLIGIVSFVVTLMTTPIVFTARVEAAPPVCVSATSASVYREVPCDSDPTIDSLARAILGEGLKDDYCYVYAADAIGIEAIAQSGSSRCGRYDLGIIQTASTAPRCYTYTGRIDNLTTYNYTDLDLGGFKESECTDSLKNQYGGNLANGVCYIFGKDNTKSTIPCSRLEQNQKLAAEAKARASMSVGDLNPEREEIANCGHKDGKSPEQCLRENPIVIWIERIINILGAGVGVAVVIGLIIGGIQYASAGPNPQKVAEAKGRIVNSLIALVAFIFLYGFLQWLTPGGIF